MRNKSSEQAKQQALQAPETYRRGTIGYEINKLAEKYNYLQGAYILAEAFVKVAGGEPVYLEGRPRYDRMMEAAKKSLLELEQATRNL